LVGNLEACAPTASSRPAAQPGRTLAAAWDEVAAELSTRNPSASDAGNSAKRGVVLVPSDCGQLC
jgi:hypothetical protein